MEIKHVSLPAAMTFGDMRAGCEAWLEFVKLNKEALKDLDKGLCEDIFWAGLHWAHTRFTREDKNEKDTSTHIDT
jgi:hypothetical protein